MKKQSALYVLITCMLISTGALAVDAEVTIRVMDIDEHSPGAVMRVIPLPDEAQLQQQDQNSTADKSQSQLSEMEMQQLEIEAQHNQPLQDKLIDQGNMPQ